jgi:peptidoglycan/LPS O-acetylase OafA/YrhL
MGLVRLILAIAVVVGHSSKTLFGFEFVHASIAVQSFYIISGFYMALILNEKYVGEGSYRLFLTNRFLRLVPTYWVILLGTIILCICSSYRGNSLAFRSFHEYGDLLSLSSWVLVIFANVFVFGQDVTLFTGLSHETGALYLTKNFWGTSPFVQNFILIPQAWSLSLEFMFYLLAPLLVRRRLWLVATVIAVSLGVRALLAWRFDLNFDPWTYRFFPSELALFLSGTFSYHIFRFLRGVKNWLKLVPLALVPLIAVLVFPYVWKDGGWVKLVCHYSVLVTTIPFAFYFTRSWAFDRFIGELSYPVYLLHIAVIWFLSVYAASWSAHKGILACVISTVLAAVIYLACKPLENYRARRVVERREKIPVAALAPGSA